MVLNEFWPFNGIESLIYDRSDNSVSKYVNGFEYKWISEEIRAIVEMVMILNFPEFNTSYFRKFQIVTMSTLTYISSAFNLYLNAFTYLETTEHHLWYNSSKYLL